MQYSSSYELYIIMHHIPCDVCSCCVPFIFPNSFVALYFYKILCRCQLSISICSLYNNLSILCPTASCVFKNSESLWKNFIKNFFLYLISILLQSFYFAKQCFFFINIGSGFYLLFYLLYLSSYIRCRCFYFFFKLPALSTQLIIRKLFDCGLYFLYFCNNFTNFL